MATGGTSQDRSSPSAATHDLALRLASVLDCDLADGVRLAPAFRERRFAHAVVLAGQGEQIARCWFVVEGALSLSAFGEDGQMALVATYGPGEVAGAFPDPREQAGELCAQGPSEVIEIETMRLRDLIACEPVAGRGLSLLLARQHTMLVDRLAGRMILSATGRIYAELLRLADGDGHVSPPPVVTALALKANTARETASRALAAAERRGLIERTAVSLRIVSAERLRGLVA